MSNNLECKKAYELATSETAMLKVIEQWKFYWMNSEPDYFERAFGIDANMQDDLAKRLKNYLNEVSK